MSGVGWISIGASIQSHYMTPNTPINSRRRLIENLSNSDLFRNYSAAFQQMTTLPLSLEPVMRDDENARDITTFSLAGVTRTRVPVKLGKALVAVLCTGGVRLAPATADAFAKVAREMLDGDHAAADIRAERDAFMKLPVMNAARYEAAVTLLRSFASHLGESTHRLLFATTSHEPEPVRLAKAYIMEHLAEPMSLESVASSVNVSPFHFCKVFKRATGMTFTDYVSHARVEKARRKLLRPDARITEIAYDVGFQSLSHFNRSFRRIVNESPTEYRAQLKASHPELAAA